MFMFHHLLWVLTLKQAPPITRLAAIYLSSNGTFIQDGPGVPPDEPTREISIAAVSEWIGCMPETLVEVIEDDLAALGFSCIQIENDIVRYSLPDLPDEPIPRPRRPQPEPMLSIYVIKGGRDAIKVGISTSVSKRVIDLQAANPVDKLLVVFEASGPAQSIRRIEKRAHAALAEFAISNEWFRVDADLAVSAVKAEMAKAGLSV